MKNLIAVMTTLFLLPAIPGSPVLADDVPLAAIRYLLFTDQTPLFDPPGNFRISVNESGQIVLSWEDNSRTETGFQIDRAQGDANSFFGHIYTTDANETSWIDTGVTGYSCGQVFTYRIRAIKESTGTAYSDSLSVYVPCPQDSPAQPANFFLTNIARGEVRLSWTDQAYNEDGYRIYRKTQADTDYRLLANLDKNSTTYTDSSAFPGTHYDYAVEAYNRYGTSARTTSSITTLTGYLQPPDQLNFFPSLCLSRGFQVPCTKLGWSYDDASMINGFDLEGKCWVEGNSEPSFPAPGGVTTPSIGADIRSTQVKTDPDESTCPAARPGLYRWRIRAYSGDATSPSLLSDFTESPILSRCPEQTIPWDGTTQLTLSAGTPASSSVHLNWNDYWTTETGWRLLRQELDSGGNVVSIVQQYLNTPNLTEFTVTNLKPETSYTFHVYPRYDSGNMDCDGSPQWNTITTAAAAAPPVPPSAVTVTPVEKSSTSLRISWTDNADNEDGYTLYRSEDGTNFQPVNAPELQTSNVTTYIDNNLSPCTTYTYKVAAYNSDGASADATASGKTAPKAPTGLLAYKGPGVYSVTLDWDDETCADQYRIYYLNESYGNPYNEIVVPGGLTQSTQIITDVQDATYVFFRVSSVDSDGHEGDLSCTVSERTPASAGATSSTDTCKAAVGVSASPVPTNLWASYNNYTDKVLVGWDSTPLTWDADGTASSWSSAYDVEISMDNINWYTLQGSPFAHPHSPPNADAMYITVPVQYPDSLYYFRVHSRFSYDCSNPADGILDECSSLPATVTGRTAAAAATTTVLPAPGVVTSKYYLNKIMVGWSTVQNADGYFVYRVQLTANQNSCPSTGYDTPYLTFLTDTNQFDDTNVLPYTGYCYTVQAYKGATKGRMSAPEYGNSTTF